MQQTVELKYDMYVRTSGKRWFVMRNKKDSGRIGGHAVVDEIVHTLSSASETTTENDLSI